VRILNLDAIRSTALHADPFEWALIDGAIDPADAAALLASFPEEDFWLIEDDDGEKAYSYAARPLVTLGADRIASLSALAPSWVRLGEELLSPSYRHALEELIGRSLDRALMEASMWRWDADAQLGPHRDMAEKIVTQVFYLSNGWDPEWGGCLRILRSGDGADVAAELPPANGTASVLVRSESSWHSVSPVRDAARQPRRSVIVTWFQPESTSPVWQVAADGSVACVAAGSVPERARVIVRTGVEAGLASRRSAPAVRAEGEPMIETPSTSPLHTLDGEKASSTRVHMLRAAAVERRALSAPPSTRVAMVGTFDIANFGDLLLPLIAAHELRERLGSEYEPTLYSYGPMTGTGWPFEVRSLAQLPADMEHFDLLLVGGGQIIRFDRGFPAGYLPADQSIHHPLGLWLTPTLLAGVAGAPVAWNAPGVATDIPEWLAPLIAAAVEAADHVAVRDEISARILCALVPGAQLTVMPDTGFGVGALLADRPSDEFTAIIEQLGIERGYVVLQPSAELLGVSGAVRKVLGAARERGLSVLELPFSPCHGDASGRLDVLGECVTPAEWPGPLRIAELIARSEAVIAQSFHAGVVAVASGVPLYRPPSPPGWKYEALEGIEGVHLLPGDHLNGAAAIDEDFGPRAPSITARERSARLSSHWDAIAALARSGRRPAPTRLALALVAGLPHELHARENAFAKHAGALRRRVRDLETERAGVEAAAAATIESAASSCASLLAQKNEVVARLSTLTAELASARARIAALDGVRDRKIVRLGLMLTRPLLWLGRGERPPGASP
jgi:Rps23 Pro-64 3,4-dihydroxylase Tpa1-like proline 4-hydroxylase